ncbi:MAG TPA: hypothetical protein VJM76_02320 [Gammaproteobacteria bacterium]|nr:hypothetical protein [Gammaproteobacteria bacterium]
MQTYPVLIALIAAATVTACEPTPKPPKVEDQSSALFTEQRQALDDANGVQQTLDQQEQERRKKLDEAVQSQ